MSTAARRLRQANRDPQRDVQLERTVRRLTHRLGDTHGRTPQQSAVWWRSALAFIGHGEHCPTKPWKRTQRRNTR